jgi:hypothetical protein
VLLNIDFVYFVNNAEDGTLFSKIYTRCDIPNYIEQLSLVQAVISWSWNRSVVLIDRGELLLCLIKQHNINYILVI